MKLNEIFEIEYPKTLIFSEMTLSKTGINFVSSQDKNNGVVAKVEECEGVKKYPAGVITVPLKGSVLMAHVQNEECYVAHQIAVLIPKIAMSLKQKLFYCLCIQKNAYRFNYGRKWTLEKMKDSVIKLPSKTDGTPDFETMEKYIRALPYGDKI